MSAELTSKKALVLRCGMRPEAPKLQYDPREEIIFVEFKGLELKNEAQVKRVFDAIHRYWSRECGGKRVYAVIDYTDFSLELGLTNTFAACVKHAVETYSITTVRFTTDVSVRATLRAVAIKTHLPSNIYATRDDAVSVVRGLKANKIVLQAS